MAKKSKQDRTGMRVLILACIILTWTAGVVCSLVRLQVVKHEWLLQEAANQRSRSIELLPKRGNIYDRNFRELAVSVQTRSIYADPGLIEDAKKAAEILAPKIRMSPDSLLEKLEHKSRFAWIRRKMCDVEAEKILALDLRGIGSLKEDKREYPKGDLAAHLLGFSGIDNQGLSGLESRYEKEIRGTAGKGVVLQDGARKRIDIKTLLPPKNGDHLVLTLDEVIQYITQREIYKAWRQNRADWVAGIVMEPGTGKILAMAGFPSFNPNHYGRSPQEHWRNRCISNLYPPGSTFKVVSVASALKAKKVSFDDVFYCREGGIQVANTFIRDHKPFSTLSLAEVLRHSSNVGAILIGSKVKPETFYRDISDFGFGQKTKIDLPGEEGGILHRVDRWSGITQAEMCIGQEIGVTALQMIRAVAAISNGGTLYQPMVVEKILSAGKEESGVLKVFQPERGHRILPRETAGKLSAILRGVVADGTGNRADIPGYEIAGKTGTAQRLGEGPCRHVSSFVGFFPVRSPKISIIVVIDNPKGEAYYGGEIAAPVFKEIARGIISYLHMPPAHYDSTIQVALSSQRNSPPPVQKKEDFTSSYPIPVARRTMRPDGISLIIQKKEMTMPDLSGLGLKKSVYILTQLGLQTRVTGTGVLIGQRPKPGAIIKPDEICHLTFSHQGAENAF